MYVFHQKIDLSLSSLTKNLRSSIPAIAAVHYHRTALSLTNVDDKMLTKWGQGDNVNIPRHKYVEKTSFKFSVQWGDSFHSNLIHDVKCIQTQFGVNEWRLFWLFGMKLSKHNSTNNFVLTKTAFNSIPKKCNFIPQSKNVSNALRMLVWKNNCWRWFRTGLIQSGAALQGSTDRSAGCRIPEQTIKIPSFSIP